MSNPPLALMDIATVESLPELARRADQDPSVGAVVLTGALGSEDAQSAMTAYVTATERDSDLPAYDPAQVAQALSHGRFVGGGSL